MVATTPFVIIFAFVGIQTVLATMPKVSKSNLSAISILGLMLMAMAPAYKSWSVIKDARIDTRDVAAMAAERLTEAVIFDKYGNYDQSKRISYYLDKEKKSGERDDVSTLAKITHYFVTADLQYYRYLTGGKLPFQKSQVHRHAAMYNKIFERPFLEIRYRHGGMFYHQPTIRIADLRSDGAALLKLSHKKFWPAHVMVTFSPGTSQ